MTTVTKIIYAANNGSMGDMTENECEEFRNWAEEEIRNEYPHAEVIIDSSDCARNCVTAREYDDEQNALDFINRLWDRQ